MGAGESYVSVLVEMIAVVPLWCIVLGWCLALFVYTGRRADNADDLTCASANISEASRHFWGLGFRLYLIS